MQQHELQLISSAQSQPRSVQQTERQLVKTLAIEQQPSNIMAPKSLVLAALLSVVVVSASQLPRGAAGLGASPNTNTSFVVSGIVPCATGPGTPST